MEHKVKPQPAAEFYTPTAIDQIELIGYGRVAFNNIINNMQRVRTGVQTFYTCLVVGHYGSGKTIVIRKVNSELLKETDNVIPIHLYIGELTEGIGGFLPFSMLKEYIKHVEDYINYGRISPDVVGNANDWKRNDKLSVLKESIEIGEKVLESKSDRAEGEIEAFFKTLEYINEKGYYPIVALDEFEHTLYTGYSLRTDIAVKTFAYFSSRALPIVRGFLYKGAFVIATTLSIPELILKALEPGGVVPEHIRKIGEHLNIDIASRPHDYPFASMPVASGSGVMDEFKLVYTEADLDTLASAHYGVTIHREILKLLGKILPTPRAVINICREAEGLGLGVVSREDFIKIIEHRLVDLKKQIAGMRINGRPILTTRSKWLDRFEALVRKGYLIIDSQKKVEIGEKVWGITGDPRKVYQKVSNIIRGLYYRGLLDQEIIGRYTIEKHIFAYLLKIPRLPEGEEATIDNIKKHIESKLKERRKK